MNERPVEGSDKKVLIEEGLDWTFSDKAITAWGGLRLVKEMMIDTH